MSGWRRVTGIEIAAMTALLVSYIWLWQGAFPGHFAVCLALYAAIGVASHARRGESAVDIGFRRDTFLRGIGLATVVVGPLALLAIATGASMGSIRGPETRSWALALFWHAAWGTAQQYGLAAFYFRRYRDVFGGSAPAAVAAAVTFASFHLPNPFLAGVTLVAGLASCWIYQRACNLWALGLAHGLLSIAISRSLPIEWTVGMRVGPGYWHVLDALARSPQ